MKTNGSFFAARLKGNLTMLWRHGDVLVTDIGGVPDHAQPVSSGVLAQGEVTGQSLRLAEPSSARLWQAGDTLFMQVVAPSARIIHEEHAPIELPRGFYLVWRQRKYTPKATVQAWD